MNIRKDMPVYIVIHNSTFIDNLIRISYFSVSNWFLMFNNFLLHPFCFLSVDRLLETLIATFKSNLFIWPLDFQIIYRKNSKSEKLILDLKSSTKEWINMVVLLLNFFCSCVIFESTFDTSLIIYVMKKNIFGVFESKSLENKPIMITPHATIMQKHAISTITFTTILLTK